MGENHLDRGWDRPWGNTDLGGKGGLKENLLESGGPSCSIPQTGLMVACYHGFGSIVALLSCCPFLDVNQQDKDGNTALMLAAQAGVRHSTLPHPTPTPPSPPTPSHPRSQPLGRQPQTSHKSLPGQASAFPYLERLAMWSCLCRSHVSGDSPAQLLCWSGPGTQGPAGTHSSDEGCHSKSL